MTGKTEMEGQEQRADRPAAVMVLRKCEDVHVRTGGFQRIEEAARRVDLRRARRAPSPAMPSSPHTTNELQQFEMENRQT